MPIMIFMESECVDVEMKLMKRNCWNNNAQVQVVVMSANMGCSHCRQRVANVVSKMNGEHPHSEMPCTHVS